MTKGIIAHKVVFFRKVRKMQHFSKLLFGANIIS